MTDLPVAIATFDYDAVPPPPSGPSLRARLFQAIVAGSFLAVCGYAVAVGDLRFDSLGWVAIGFIVFLVGFAINGVGPTVVYLLALAGVTAFLLNDRQGGNLIAGCVVPVAAAAAIVFCTRAGGLLADAWEEIACRVMWRRYLRAEDARLTREAAAGLEDCAAYLEQHAKVTAPQTLAKMKGDVKQLIGLSGYAGAGKDTVAAGLIVDRDYTRVSFADKLREFLLALDPLIPVEVETYTRHDAAPASRIIYKRVSDYLAECGGDWTIAKQNPEVRALLQRLGTDAGRTILGENVWVDAVMRDLPDGPVVFTDCRFPNEAQAVKDAGGYVVRVSRPGVEAVNAHVSETALDDWDFDAAVVNEGTPAEARQQMLAVEALFYDPETGGDSTVFTSSN